MKRAKSLLSILLAAVLMLGLIPMTATAADTDGELAGTGAIIHNVTTAAELKAALELVDKNSPHRIVVKNDIIETIGTPGDYSDKNYIPVWCTVGKGEKVLDLNSYTVELKSDYCAIYDGFSMGAAYLEAKSNECLFSIPDGADLTVNGGYTSSTYAGAIRYKGVLLNKCDAIDQRDIFHLDGGYLTINSGNYAPGWTRKKYTWEGSTFASGYTEYMQVNGTPITVNDGYLTVNGGYFEGIGLNTYSFKLPSNFDTYDYARNAAIKVNGSSGGVTINNGHFYGRSHASCISGQNLESARIMVRSGRFQIDQSDTTISMVYGDHYNVTSYPGKVGLPIPTYYADTLYYSTNPTTIYTSSNANKTTVMNLRTPDFYVLPQSRVNSSPLPSKDCADVTFEDYTYDIESPVTWDVTDDHYIEVKSSSLYYPNLYSEANNDVVQDLYGYVDIYKLDSAMNKTLVYEHRAFAALPKDGNPNANWVVNITGILSEADREALKNKQRYVLEFIFYEQLETQPQLREASHKASYCVNIHNPNKQVKSVDIRFTEPKAGTKPTYKVSKLGSSCDFYTGLGLLVMNGTGIEFIDHSKGQMKDAFSDIALYVTKDETFKAGQKYTARVFLWTGDKGDDVYFDKSFTAKVNGKAAKVSDLSSGKESICWVDYTFTVGESSGGYWIGDVNDDGSVKNRDALILDRYIAGWKDYDKQIKNWDAADLNRDGQIKNRDALMLDRYIAGWKDYQKYVYKVNG